jgi:ELWxxDGT repeat protein
VRSVTVLCLLLAAAPALADPAPAVLVKDIFSGAGGSQMNGLTAVNGTLFFVALDYFEVVTPGHGYALWKSDGTAAGTVLVKETWPGPSGIRTDGITNTTLRSVGARVVFAASDGVTGREPWVSDGTASGTKRLADVNASGSSDPTQLLGTGSLLLFGAIGDGTGKELYAMPVSALGLPEGVPLFGVVAYGALTALLVAVAARRGRRT